ncbi:Bax inhibitor-1/YccA family protein [Desulforhabdus amnigena]|jgi:FtsH-binding integral membrane protein|uniref:Membrane protein n=1 Tax=Desulforhabdus amnigena TaxID=40218 RepID=A0A9W6CWU4_9BACT|nr:Bax inhibitor-1/YccA family protein [Desulforhabdus amnigena]NLJ26677.1 Bax inhibitor-1/YccA family protein [Deltaproteobacteria bacterium]GLI33316.1 membrane protein [Desulforhabdus amnigena]
MDRQIYYPKERIVAVQSDFILRVYNWMGLGLATTAVVSLFTASSPAMISMIFGSPVVFFGLIVGELGLVIALSAAINRLRASTAVMMFFLYSAINGLTLAAIFLAYTRASISTTFFITAGTFGAMSLYGHATRKDLTSWSSFLTMGLIGVVLASLVNIFFQSEAIYWVITYAGIIVFVGLTAYDAQQIKVMALQGFGDEEAARKGAVIGALRLYLDFINLFLMLLRLFGRRE